MEELLAHIQNTTGKVHTCSCNSHKVPSSICGGCFKTAYCSVKCQAEDWSKNHRYQCIGMKRDHEEDEDERVIDLDQLRDLWDLIFPYLNVQDKKNLRLASRQTEQRIRRTYFQNFQILLTPENYQNINPDIIPFISNVLDTSGGSISYRLFQEQRNKVLKAVRITGGHVDWERVVQLVNLQKLWLSNNQLVALPNSFGQLTNLTELGLGDNQLAALPDSFGMLTNLTELGLNNNQLAALPDSFGMLTNLTRLGLSNNQLVALPASFINLYKLQTFRYDNNPQLERWIQFWKRL